MMFADIRAVYNAAWRFSLACPLLFAIPVLVEFAQHVIEMQAGMYVDEAGAQAAEGDLLRMQFGYAKTLALLLPGYWFTRYVMFGGDGRRAARLEWPAIGLWLVIFALLAAEMAWGLFGPSLADLVGAGGASAIYLSVGSGLILQIVMIYLSAWLVAWPLGNAGIGPIRSVAIMHGSFWHAVGLFVASVMPLMVLHYGLAITAVVGLPSSLDWAAMVLDSLVVGYLALMLTGCGVYAARRAAIRKNVDLLPANHPGELVAI